MTKKTTSESIEYCFGSGSDEDKNIVDAVLEVAKAMNRIADALHRLGLADAATPMGAIELLSNEVRTGFSGLNDNIYEVANALNRDKE